ncbi:hypothetical protein VPH35_100277 [Triticum aestivum]
MPSCWDSLPFPLHARAPYVTQAVTHTGRAKEGPESSSRCVHHPFDSIFSHKFQSKRTTTRLFHTRSHPPLSPINPPLNLMFILTHHPHSVHNTNTNTDRSRSRATRSNGGREGPGAAGLLGEPVRAARPHRAGGEGPALRVRGGGPDGRQERPPPPRQPGAQEDPGAPPRRPPRQRVPHHPPVPGGRLPGRPGTAPLRPLRARAGPLLGRLRRQEGLRLRLPPLEAQGRAAGAGARRDAGHPQDPRRRARGQALLRRRQVRVRRRRLRALHRVVPQLREVRRVQPAGGGAQDRGVGQALRRAGERRQEPLLAGQGVRLHRPAQEEVRHRVAARTDGRPCMRHPAGRPINQGAFGWPTVRTFRILISSWSLVFVRVWLVVVVWFC